MRATFISKTYSSNSTGAADQLMTHPAEAGFRSLLTRSHKWTSETCASTLLSASFVFCALGEKSLFPSPFSDSVFLDERTQARVGPSRSHSSCTCSCLHTPCTCLPSLFLALQNPRNSSLKVFSSATSWQQPRWPSVCPEEKESWAQCFPLDVGASCRSLIHGQSSF